MMGQLPANQQVLFYDFSLEQHIPSDHLLRQIDQVLDLGDVRQHLCSFYSPTGRPSIDPELMIRMLIVGYCYGIRSERQLCEEVHLNLGYRWFCGLGLEDEVPDHSTFCKNRHGRFRDSDLFRQLFEGVVHRCMAEGLVGGEGFAIDASVIRADANRQRGVPAIGADAHFDASATTRPIREYLDALDGDVDPRPVHSNVSLTDPQTQWTAATGGRAFYAYSTNYLMDIEQNIIVDVEPTPALRTAEVNSTKQMIERVEKQFGLKPQRLIGDTAYGSAPGWSRTNRSSHMWRSTINQTPILIDSTDLILSLTPTTIGIDAQRVNGCSPGNATSPNCDPISLKRTPLFIVPASEIVAPASTNTNAVPIRRFAKSLAVFMRHHEMSPGALLKHLNTNNRAMIVRRWRFSSLTSNGS